MNIQELFDTLLLERQVEVQLAGKDQAESLRTQLSKRWSKYKKDMNNWGYLSEELQCCSLCLRSPANTDSFIYSFLLIQRQRTSVSYTIVTNANSYSQDQQDSNATV